MKRLLLFTLLALCFVNLMGKLTETKKTLVDFPKFGVYESTSTEKFDGLLKRVDSDSKLEGRSIWGKLLSGFFPKGNQAVIYDLNEKLLYNLDLDKEEYDVNPIEQIFSDDEYDEYDDAEVEEEDEEEVDEEPTYKIIRQEFKIIDKKEIIEYNQFTANKYQIHYLLEKMEIETKKITIDSLYVDVYTSEDKSLFEKAAKEKQEFNLAMMEAIGFELEEQDYQEMLGINWIKKLQAMDQENESGEMDVNYKEFDKIKGSPVYIDGNYYVKQIDPPKKEKKSKGFGGLSGLKKSIMKKAEDAVTKKDESIYKKVIAYKTETIAIEFKSVDSSDFKVPAGFTEKK